MKRMTVNKAKCKLCHDVIESNHVQALVQCKCGACSVDGGLEYRRWLGNINMIDMSEYESECGCSCGNAQTETCECDDDEDRDNGFCESDYDDDDE